MTRDEFKKHVAHMEGAFARPTSRFFGYSATATELPSILDKAVTCFKRLPEVSRDTPTRHRCISTNGVVLMATTDEEQRAVIERFGKPHFTHPAIS